MRMLLATALIVAGAPAPAPAQDVRVASEAEIVTALQGCWDKEQQGGGLSQKEADGSFSSSVVCFGTDSTVKTMGYSIHPKWGGEGLGSSGTYTVSADKLELRTELSDGWIFGYTAMSCDVMISIGRAFRLQNCIGSGENWFDASEEPRAVPNMSFAFSDNQAQGEWP